MPVTGSSSLRMSTHSIVGVAVAKKDMTSRGTGWNKAALTQRRDKARSASAVGIGPPQLVVSLLSYVGIYFLVSDSFVLLKYST